eukprot:gene182-biopygen161
MPHGRQGREAGRRSPIPPAISSRADTWDLPRLQRVEITWAWLRYRASPSTRFVVASVYAPPAIPAPTLTADMEKLLASPAPNTVLVGDYNATHESWDRYTRSGLSATQGQQIFRMIAAASSRFLLHAPPTPTCLRGSPPSTIDFFVATGECYPVDVIPGNFSDHHPITATCYLDDLPPLREMVSRVAWRPSMPVCWSRVTQDDRKKFVLNAAHRFQRHPPASAECAADWFTKQLLRCGAHLPKQAPGTGAAPPPSVTHERKPWLPSRR